MQIHGTSESYKSSVSPVIQIHIADIHFGSSDPAQQYAILVEQFLSKICHVPFHILSIDGDLFHKKYMANSDPVYYASKFINDCVNICRSRNATLLILSGTESHDAGQLRLFDQYKEDPTIDVRIVNHICFQYIYGLKILCIPEEYGKGEDYYLNYLSESYDMCIFHGTIVGSVYGANEENLNSPKYPIFSIDSFSSCRGPIIGGHVHKAMCLNSFMYYVSNPIRFAFGEEEDKGYAIVLVDKTNMSHYYQFMPIESFRYDTIDVRTLNTQDPNEIIQHLNNLKASGIDNIRIDFSAWNNPQVQHMVEQYYSTNPSVAIKGYTEKSSIAVNTTEEIMTKYNAIDFLLDPRLDEYTKFVQFINHNEGINFITVDQLKDVLSGKDIF